MAVEPFAGALRGFDVEDLEDGRDTFGAMNARAGLPV